MPASPPQSYDVVIIGGAIMGAATAWFLTEMADFTGTVAVIERDQSLAQSSTMHTTSWMRTQFSIPLNVQISQFAHEYVTHFPEALGGDPRVPALDVKPYGYLYLADTPEAEAHFRACAQMQQGLGAPTEIVTPEEIAARFPFYDLTGIRIGSLGSVGEGPWDASAVCDWWRRLSRERGVAYLTGDVAGMTRRADGRVESVTLGDGTKISCGAVVNCTGPRAARTAAMAGIDIPVVAKKRMSYVFRAARPLDHPLPLTIDPCGVHVSEFGGGLYLTGGHGTPDPEVEPDDFAPDHGLWEEHIWPVIATRIPAFEAVKVQSEWAGHYAMNTLDHNAIVGAHPEITNFYFLNGFSGHGLQQAPAMGRAMAELLTFGAYRSLDLSPFGFERIAAGRPLLELAVI